MKKILWIAGCNSISPNGIKTNFKKIIEKHGITAIINWADVNDYDLTSFDKIIYDDSNSAVSSDRTERTSFCRKFISDNPNINVELITHDWNKGGETMSFKQLNKKII